MIARVEETVPASNRWEQFPVLEDDYGIRPAGPQDECFFCHQKVGIPHLFDCVVICVEDVYEVFVDDEKFGEWTCQDPASWDQHDCEFHKNDSSWCTGNILRFASEKDDQDSLPKFVGNWKGLLLKVNPKIVNTFDREKDHICLCGVTEFRLKTRGTEVKRAGD